MARRSNPQPDRYYWDANLFLSFIEGDEAWSGILNGILDDCDSGRVLIFTSVWTIAEVAFDKAEKDGKALDLEVEAEIDRLWHPDSAIRLIEFHELLAYDSKTYIREAIARGWTGLKPKDAVHFSAAKSVGVSEMHTLDKNLHKYSAMFPFKVCYPHSDRLPFPAPKKRKRKLAGKKIEPKRKRPSIKKPKKAKSK